MEDDDDGGGGEEGEGVAALQAGRLAGVLQCAVQGNAVGSNLLREENKTAVRMHFFLNDQYHLTATIAPANKPYV